jgi:hypothetical protein
MSLGGENVDSYPVSCQERTECITRSRRRLDRGDAQPGFTAIELRFLSASLAVKYDKLVLLSLLDRKKHYQDLDKFKLMAHP